MGGRFSFFLPAPMMPAPQVVPHPKPPTRNGVEEMERCSISLMCDVSFRLASL